MIVGQVRDYTNAAALPDDLPKAQWLLGDRSYDVNLFSDDIQAQVIQPCIPAGHYATSRSHTTSANSGTAAA